MAEPPKRRADASPADASRVDKPMRTPSPKAAETGRSADSVPTPAGPFASLPMKFGRYDVRRELGKGQMGAVYLAHDTGLDRLVALKVARTSATGSDKLLKRMEIEAKSAAKIDHPHVCKVYDFGEIDGIRFIAQQYIEGENLKQFMKRLGRKREPEEAVRIILQILRALEAAHEKGVIHRDLKPENVMLNKKNEPVIMDFGLARKTIASSDAGLTQGMIVGTAAYMSPEQAQGKAEAIDHRSDLYAVGVMLFEMLTGEWPFIGGAIEVMGKKCVLEPPSPLSLNPGLNPQLATVCYRMIAKQKGDRYITCVEAAAALEAIDLKATVVPTPLVHFAEFVPSIQSIKETPNFDLQKKSSAVSAIGKLPTVVGKKNSGVGKKKGSSQSLSFGVYGPLIRRWSSQLSVLRWTMYIGAGIGLVALAVILFLPTKNGVLKIEIDDPSLSVKFDGSTITMDNDNQPIKISKTSNKTLEILYNHGTTVESFTKEIALKKGDNRIVKVTLVVGGIAIDGHRFNSKPSEPLSLVGTTVDVPKSHDPSRFVVETVDASQPLEPLPFVDMIEDVPMPSEPLQFGGMIAGEERELTPGIKFRWCPPGTFFMGSPAIEIPRKNDEDLVQVTLTSGFWLGETEVTQGQWKSMMKSEPWQGRRNVEEGPDYAASNITHGDGREGDLEADSASEFCGRMTEQERTAGRLPVGWKYALPTEAQWEYACRAGTTTKYHFGDDVASLSDYDWWNGNCYWIKENYAHQVGLKKPNAWGLYDMQGNVWEWCRDWYGEKLPGGSDPSGPLHGLFRVRRGGSWGTNAECARSASRYNGVSVWNRNSYQGFRLAVVPSSE